MLKKLLSIFISTIRSVMTKVVWCWTEHTTKEKNWQKRCQWHELHENMKAKYSLNFHFIWIIVYKGLPAKYSASSKVQQNAGVAFGTVGQEVQSKVKGIKVAEKIPIHVYSTDKRKYHFKKRNWYLWKRPRGQENCKNLKWTEYKATINLHYFSA